MSLPKGKLFILLALVAAIGLVTATGAFGSVTAQRTADVEVAGDDAALIGLEPGSGGSVSDYVSGGNEITIDLTNVNTNATTEIPNALNITNRGSQTVGIQITRNGINNASIAFAVQSSELETTPSNDLTWPENNVWRIDDGGSPIDLQPGESIQVGIYIDTSDGDVSDGLNPGPNSIGQGDEIITSVTVNANTSNVDTGTNLDAAN